mmetsp:Transcript_2706/g.6302  ORF Transcript_2706/g.6302 Transcript_2706/m.6302 type:complete len:286 (-) Transcript_2706:154-1011(-)
MAWGTGLGRSLLAARAMRAPALRSVGKAGTLWRVAPHRGLASSPSVTKPATSYAAVVGMGLTVTAISLGVVQVKQNDTIAVLESLQSKNAAHLDASQREFAARLEASQQEFKASLEASQREFAAKLGARMDGLEASQREVKASLEASLREVAVELSAKISASDEAHNKQINALRDDIHDLRKSSLDRDARDLAFRNKVDALLERSDGVAITYSHLAGSNIVQAPLCVGSSISAAFKCARELAPKSVGKFHLYSPGSGQHHHEGESHLLGVRDLKEGLTVILDNQH